MKISSTDSIKIQSMVKSHPLGEIYYANFIELFGKNKYSYNDYLEYFITNSYKALEKENYSIKQFNKYLFLIESFINCLEERYSFNCEDLKNKYLDNAYKYNKDIDSESLDLFKEINNALDNNSKLEITKKEDIIEVKDTQENVIEDKSSIDKLKTSIAHKKSKINELKQVIEGVKDNLENKDKENKVKDEEIDKLKKEVKKQTRTNEKLESDYNKLKLEYEKLIGDLKSSNKYDPILKIQELEDSLNNLKEELKDYKQVQKRNEYLEKIYNDNEDKEKIKEKILELFYSKKYSVDKLQELLSNEGIIISKDDLYNTINEVSNYINLDISRLSNNGPIYQITKPAYKTNQTITLDINKGRNNIEFLLVSDFHIDDVRRIMLENYSALLDYAENNHINKIINLGDFFDFGRKGYTNTLNNLNTLQEIVFDASQKIPYDKGIYHLVLGGNHDVWNMYLGYDFLNDFINKRDDFISLGYENATINLEGDTTLSKLFLSHTNDKLDRTNLSNRIRHIKSYFSLDNNYSMFFFGHSHESYLDITNKVCVSPSLTVDKVANGAWHIKFIFNKDELIGYSFKPLVIKEKNDEYSYSKKLVPTTEVLCINKHQQ